MSEERLPNRWLFVAAAIVMQLCLGNLYSWSIFRNPLMELHGWTIQQATLPFTLSIVFFAIGMVFAGRWQDKAGPRPVAITGGIILGTGLFLASQAGDTLPGLYLGYGVLAGLGVGFAYVTPIAVCIKWFPDMRGAIAGLAVFGFGAGSMVGAPLGTALIEKIGVYSTFATFAIAFGVLVSLAGAMLRNPPASYKPAGWTPPSVLAGHIQKYDYSPSEMVKTIQFWLLWLIYLFWAGVGLMVISQAVPMGSEMADLSPAVAAGALGTTAIFNGLGRLAFGWISDKIGRLPTTVLAQGFYIIALLIVLPNAKTLTTYTAGISMVGFTYGGALALMPAFTADYFGTKNLDINYGWLYSAWGCAGILGPIIGAQVRAATGAWTGAFFILAALSALAAVLAFIIRAPAPRRAAVST